MHCIWCDHETTTDQNAATDKLRYANKEHIFPEAVGGKKCLTQGLVCEQCNGDLGREIDQYLKTGDISMMHQYQIVDGIPGKNRSKEDRLRKLAQKKEINHYTGSTTVRRSKEKATTTFVNAGFYTHDEKFSRALHKCLINSIIDMSELDALPEELQPLKNYVLTGKSEDTEWAIGLAYANMFDRHHFEPFCDCLILDPTGNIIAGVLVFPSLLAIVGCTPGAISKEFLWVAAHHLYKKHKTQYSKAAGFDVISYFKGNGFVDFSGRKSVHRKMNIILVKKHLRGIPISGKLQRLVKCAYCGQINPTGIEYEKTEILHPSNNLYASPKNDWNIYERKDMPLIFDPTYARYFDLHFQSHQKDGIQIDISKLDSLRENWSAQIVCCIGCGGHIHAQPKDYFF